jgi:hypothetical protein
MLMVNLVVMNRRLRVFSVTDDRHDALLLRSAKPESAENNPARTAMAT